MWKETMTVGVYPDERIECAAKRAGKALSRLLPGGQRLSVVNTRTRTSA